VSDSLINFNNSIFALSADKGMVDKTITKNLNYETSG